MTALGVGTQAQLLASGGLEESSGRWVEVAAGRARKLPRGEEEVEATR